MWSKLNLINIFSSGFDGWVGITEL